MRYDRKGCGRAFIYSRTGSIERFDGNGVVAGLESGNIDANIIVVLADKVVVNFSVNSIALDSSFITLDIADWGPRNCCRLRLPFLGDEVDCLGIDTRQ